MTDLQSKLDLSCRRLEMLVSLVSCGGLLWTLQKTL